MQDIVVFNLDINRHTEQMFAYVVEGEKEYNLILRRL